MAGRSPSAAVGYREGVDTPFSDLTRLGQTRRLRPLAIGALEAYDLGPTRLRLLSNDWNCTFRVDSPSGPRVLRVMRRHAAIAGQKVRSEDEFVRALVTATGIGAPRTIPTRSGDPYVQASAAGVPEPRACVLLEWVRGRPLSDRVDTSRWAALGELMARMHRFAEGWEPSRSFGAVVYASVLAYGAPLVLFESDRVDLLGLDGLLREAYEVTNERIATIMREQQHIVIHGDMHGENVKVYRNELTPFDWEDLLWGVPILDVANSLYYVRHRADYLELAGAFRAGYERHRPWVETRPGEVDRLLVARGIDMLNFIALDPALHFDDMEAYVRLREVPALVAVGALEPVIL
jgi:Ser/Thr protein kinase RdoA (MazF antagonist)